MIEVLDVSKNFGALAALSHVSLSIAPGERVAFVGPNGSGKTTLLRALLGLIRTSGCIRIGGVDVAKEPELALKHVSYIPQVAPPTDAPVREVVRAIAALRQLEPRRIVERALSFGLELEACAETRFVHLSGGMKQKLLAAAALAADTPVLVADEPTANLDAAARQVFFEELRRGRDDRLIILCSHRADELVQVAERVVEFKDGRIDRDRIEPVRHEPASDQSRRLRTAC
jgi:ABC-type multidrug transport system ATPase subunit